MKHLPFLVGLFPAFVPISTTLRLERKFLDGASIFVLDDASPSFAASVAVCDIAFLPLGGADDFCDIVSQLFTVAIMDV